MSVQVALFDKAQAEGSNVADAAIEKIVGARFDVTKFVENFDVLAEAAGGIKKLRELAIELAAKGLLLEGADPAKWKQVVLADVALDIQNGISKRRGDAGSPVPVLRLADIESGTRLRQTELREIVLTSAEQQNYSVRPGDILVIRVNGSGDLVGRFVPCDVDRKLAYSDHLIRVRLDPTLVDPAFLCALSRSAVARAHLQAKTVTTAGQKTINQQGLGSLPFLLPPLAEQKRIVAKVDQLMALCDDLEARQTKKRETGTRLTRSALEALTTAESSEEFDAAWKRVVENFDVLIDRAGKILELRRAILELAVRGGLVHGRPSLGTSASPAATNAFALPPGWYWAKVGETFDVSGGIQKTPARTPRANHYPYLRVENVQRGRLDLDRMERFELAPGELERWHLERGDLLVVEGNGSEKEIGRCAIWTGEIEDCVHQNHIIRCRALGPLQPAFTLLFLNSPTGMAEMKALAITTSGLFSLSVGKIRGIDVPVPPAEEQERIVAQVGQLMKVCDELEARLRRAEERAAKLVEAVVQGLVA